MKVYERLDDIEEDYRLLLIAQERITSGGPERALSFHEAMENLDISDTDLNKAETFEIE